MTQIASDPAIARERAEFTRLLVIGGSDSCGGAGIQADIKTGALLGVEVAAVITAITAQNSVDVRGVWPVPVEALTAQLTSVCEDIPPHAVKLGMLWDAQRVEAVAAAMHRYKLFPVVCDPVLASTSGRMLMDVAGRDAVLAFLPQIFLLTPNREEAAVLSGRSVSNEAELLDAGRALLDRGVHAVLLKGGHMGEEDATDILLIGGAAAPQVFTTPRIATHNDHGTGCVLASAIAAGLAKGNDLANAIATAKFFLQQALQRAVTVWNGNGRGGMRLSSS
jgi:hydroxymethylpyrimidine/phosphomethylpyrimidine kinase